MGWLGAFRWSTMEEPHRLTSGRSISRGPKSSYAPPGGQREQSPVVSRSPISGHAEPTRNRRTCWGHHEPTQFRGSRPSTLDPTALGIIEGGG